MGSPSRSSSSKKRSKERRHSRSSSSHSSSSQSKSKRSYSQGRNRGQQRREPEKIPPTTKLFVTNIDSKFTQEELDRDLRLLFEPFGKIKEVIVKTKAGSTNSYCFIDYEDIESSTRAQEELKGKDFKGKELKVEFGRGQRKTEDRRSDKCYICHKTGHFAKDCRYNRYTGSAYNGEDKYRRQDRGRDPYYRDRDRDRDRGYDHHDRYDRDRERDYRDRDHRRHHRRSRSSSSSHYKHRHDRGRDHYDQRRRDRRSPDRRGSNYHSSSHRY